MLFYSLLSITPPDSPSFSFFHLANYILVTIETCLLNAFCCTFLLPLCFSSSLFTQLHLCLLFSCTLWNWGSSVSFPSFLLSVEPLHLLLWPIVVICKERIRFEYVRWIFIAGIRNIDVAMYYMQADKEGKVSFMVCAINYYWLYKWPPLNTTLRREQCDCVSSISSSSQIVYDLLFFLDWQFFFVHLFCKTLLKFPITIFNENVKLQTPLRHW